VKLTLISIRLGRRFIHRFIQAPVDEDGRVRMTAEQVWDLFDLPAIQRPRPGAVWNAHLYGIW
jgi:hypothetical protein